VERYVKDTGEFFLTLFPKVWDTPELSKCELLSIIFPNQVDGLKVKSNQLFLIQTISFNCLGLLLTITEQEMCGNHVRIGQFKTNLIQTVSPSQVVNAINYGKLVLSDFFSIQLDSIAVELNPNIVFFFSHLIRVYYQTIKSKVVQNPSNTVNTSNIRNVSFFCFIKTAAITITTYNLLIKFHSHSLSTSFFNGSMGDNDSDWSKYSCIYNMKTASITFYENKKYLVENISPNSLFCSLKSENFGLSYSSLRNPAVANFVALTLTSLVINTPKSLLKLQSLFEKLYDEDMPQYGKSTVTLLNN
jgi:hypothetical protein